MICAYRVFPTSLDSSLDTIDSALTQEDDYWQLSLATAKACCDSTAPSGMRALEIARIFPRELFLHSVGISCGHAALAWDLAWWTQITTESRDVIEKHALAAVEAAQAVATALHWPELLPAEAKYPEKTRSFGSDFEWLRSLSTKESDVDILDREFMTQRFGWWEDMVRLVKEVARCA